MMADVRQMKADGKSQPSAVQSRDASGTSEPDIQGFIHLDETTYFNRKAPISKSGRVFKGGMISEGMQTRPVVVKLFQLNIAQYNAKRFKREVETLESIRHPYFIKYLHAGISKEHMLSYLVMEECKIVNLHDHVLNMREEIKRLSFSDCKTSVKQLSSGLKRLHEEKLLHRDIKPSNILLSKDGTCLKLSDFSLAKPLRAERSVTADSSKRIGTDGWRAPEALIGGKHGEKADVFSLGLSLYFIWSNGEHAFGDDPDLVNHHIKMNVNRNLTKIYFEDSKEAEPLRELVEKMLEFEEEHRLSATELAELCKEAEDVLENWEGEMYQPLPSTEKCKCGTLKSPRIVVFERTTKSMHSFEPFQRSWLPMQTIDSKMLGWNMTAVRAGDHIYVFMEDKSVVRINHTRDNAVWEYLKSMDLQHGDLPPAALLGEYIYVIGQSAPKSPDPRRGERFDLTTLSWSSIPNMETKREAHTVVVCNGRVYSIGGNDCGNTTALGEKFDPVTKEWSSIAPMNICRFGASAAAMNDKIFMLGGARTGGFNLNDAEVYDTNTDVWTKITNMIEKRCYFGAVTVNGKIYAINGHGKSPMTIEEYEPQNEKWEYVEEEAWMAIFPGSCISIE